MHKEQKSIVVKTHSAFTKGKTLVSENESTEEIDTVVFEGSNATVSVGKTLTRNLGNYESLKVTGHVSVPCHLNEDEIDTAFDFANRKLDENLAKIMNEELACLSSGT